MTITKLKEDITGRKNDAFFVDVVTQVLLYMYFNFHSVLMRFETC